MTDQPAFEYRDHDGDSLHVASLGEEGLIGLAIETRSATNAVHIPVDRVEEVVAGIRDAARQAAGQPAAEPVVAYLDDFPRVTLYCREHGEGRPKLVPRTADDLPFGGICTTCGRDVLILAGQPDPTTADDPTPLRWGLGDVLYGDDGTITVCMSGPDRESYWLELEPDQAAVLDEYLAGPGREEPQDHPGAELYAQLRKAGNDHETTNRLIYAHARMVIRQHQALNDDTSATDPAAPTNHHTETEARRAIYSSLMWPEWNPRAERRGTSDSEAEQLLDAYRTAVLREAADAVARFTGNDLDANAKMLRRLAAGAES